MKTSIGQFIAALRKASGMTQQDIADRLNVSNKAVSRWERDECAPDISLIPSLAELLGVSCDELLRGERILDVPIPAKKDGRIEKQVASLVNRTLSTFKTLNYIAVALAAIGLVCMLGITAAFYRPTLGFFVSLLFEVAALTVAAVALVRAKDIKKDNELFEKANEEQASRFDKTLGNFSFHAFYIAFATTALSLRIFATAADPYWSYSHLTEFPFTALILAIVYLKGKPLYMDKKSTFQKNIAILTLVQMGATIIAGILFVVAPYFHAPFFDMDIPRICDLPVKYFLINALAFLLLGLSVACFAVYTAKHKKVCLSGVRNLFLLPAVFIVDKAHDVAWDNTGYHTDYIRLDLWLTQYFWHALAYCLVTVLIFSFVEFWVQKRK